MAEQVKREVKEQAQRRREERVANVSGDRVSASATSTGRPSSDVATPLYNLLSKPTDTRSYALEPRPEASAIPLEPGNRCTRPSKDTRDSIGCLTSGRSDTTLLMFYLENLLPFLFPFYRPSVLQGGRAWLLEMMVSSPVVRQATLCQSSYFFSLARGTANQGVDHEQVLPQTTDAFAVLRQALQVINGSGIAEHIHGAVRIMASIIQMQRFEIAVLSFHSWQTHLNAAVALLTQILDSADHSGGEPGSSFNTVMSRLAPSPTMPGQIDQVPSPEQAAFSFSSALVIFDDIIASTTLREQPRLYEYHRNLLGDVQDTDDSPINLETVIGLQNWVLLHISEIAALDAWKKRCSTAGNLDVIELVHRATAIKESMIAHLSKIQNDSTIVVAGNTSPLDIYTPPPSQGSSVTRVWTHAALIYLCVVVSGWQPANVDVRYHVGQVIELLEHQTSPALLRTMAWPFSVTGCLAQPAQEACFRGMVEVLQPPSIFGTMHNALEIIENVWHNRDVGVPPLDLATCFRIRGDLVLLV
ncbi:Fc.00g026820.m01.CDS01 [Cosmosporella sp. VM-42]